MKYLLKNIEERRHSMGFYGSYITDGVAVAIDKQLRVFDGLAVEGRNGMVSHISYRK